jgi:hypothetical protein
MLKLTGGTHDNSRSKRYIHEAALGCFFKFCIRVHSAIHLHCARKQCKFTCTVANSASELHCSLEQCKFTQTVQVNCTVPVNSAIYLHCSGVFFFFYSVYSFCIYIYFLKTSFTLSCKQYFLSWKTSIERIKFTRTVISN